MLDLIDAAKARAFAAVNTVLIELYWRHRRAHQPEDRRGRLGPGDGRSPGRIHPEAPSQMRGFSAQNLWRMRQFYETYRDQPKLVSTAERIVLDPQPAHPGQVQTGRGTRVLPPAGRIAEMAKPRAGTPDRRRPVRARRPVAGKTLSTAERIAPRRRSDLQGHVSRRVP